MENLVNFGHREGHCLKFQNLEDEKSLKNQKSDKPTCQQPTTDQGCVSRPAHAVTPRWLGHHPPPRVGDVNRSPPPLHAQPMQSPPPHACHALISRSGHAETPFPSSSSVATKLLPHSALPLTALLYSKRRALTTEHRPRAPRSHAEPATTLSHRPP
jgi:hypothetical protein